MFLLLANALAQNSGAVAEPSHLAAIQGTVIKEPDGQAVKKALIELIAENQSEGGDYTATSAADGSFRIENILPGRYHLFAERNGFLEIEKQRGRSEGRRLTLVAGQEVKDLVIRLQSAAVVHGRVTDEDGDPLPNAEVTVFRWTFATGHRHWEQAGSERSNDLGEYRIPNLIAGNVYVSVVPPPDFKSLIEGGAAANPSHSAPDKPAPMTYQTTYYPGTTDRSQAAPLQLHAGDDLSIDFSLVPSARLSIHGSLLNVPPQSSASILLQSRDFSLVLSGTEMRKDGTFLIPDVSPGSYTIVATVEGSVPMMARQSLQVGSSNVEGVRLSPQPGATIRGRLRLEGKKGQFDPTQLFVSLRSVDGEDEALGMLQTALGQGLDAHVNADGTFEWSNVPTGSYVVQFTENSGASELAIKSVLAGGRDVSDTGVAVNGGVVALDLVATTDGGVIEGVIADANGNPIPDAVVIAVPNPTRRNRADFRKAVSDQNGRFSLPGLRSGQYTVLAWESLDGEPYYDREFLKSYEDRGTAVQVSEGERKAMRVKAIAEAQEER